MPGATRDAPESGAIRPDPRRSPVSRRSASVQKNTLEVKVSVPEPTGGAETRHAGRRDLPDAARRTRWGRRAPEAWRVYVPKTLVQTGTDGPFVWWPTKRPAWLDALRVELGAEGAEARVEITRGLNISSRLIATGHEQLHDGARIRVTDEAPSEKDGE